MRERSLHVYDSKVGLALQRRRLLLVMFYWQITLNHGFISAM